MNKDTVEVAVIIDCSGSMDSVKTDAMGSYNKFINVQKKLPGECNVTGIMFNTAQELFYKGSLKDCPPLTDKQYQPSGMTALYDAMGQPVKDMFDAWMQEPEANRPKVTVAVLTDGEENSSNSWDVWAIAKLYQQCRHYGWTFTFIGMNVDLNDQFTELCNSVGIDENHRKMLGSNKEVGRGIAMLSASVTSTRLGGDGSLMQVDASDESYTEEEIKKDPTLIFKKKPSPFGHLKKE